MKVLLKVFIFTTMILVFLSGNYPMSRTDCSSYDIVAIYDKIDLKDGTKSIDNYGNVKEAQAIIVPTQLERGKYKVELTKISSDFYQICGSSLYLETRYCYEYAMRTEAILDITSNYGYSCGEVIFIE